MELRIKRSCSSVVMPPPLSAFLSSFAGLASPAFAALGVAAAGFAPAGGRAPAGLLETRAAAAPVFGAVAGLGGMVLRSRANTHALRDEAKNS
jgi:hypothetical protein